MLGLFIALEARSPPRVWDWRYDTEKSLMAPARNLFPAFWECNAIHMFHSFFRSFQVKDVNILLKLVCVTIAPTSSNTSEDPCNPQSKNSFDIKNNTPELLCSELSGLKASEVSSPVRIPEPSWIGLSFVT